ncbi:MAG TPA: aryldialkylphosphatase [Dehalococcoidia bacterium]|jgi:phosphotriesterase-related protein|nr:aryldialkylphosphatase [Dehalococcoidia bacterium]
MNRADLVGKVQTVLGIIDPQDLGITLTHEHCLLDMAVWFMEPAEASQRALAHQPITLENIGWVRYHPMSHRENLRLLDEELAIKELQLYKLAGGHSLVDVTNIGLARDPMALRRIARATGLNIIMGSGYYAGPAHPPEVEGKTEEEIAEEIVHDIMVGVADTGVRAGIIGELGCSWPLMDSERKVLRAGARAQQLTGAALTIHPGRHESAYREVLDFLGNAGADLSRTIIDHFDRCLFDRDRRLKLVEDCAKTGCYIEYDLFGWEGYYPFALAPQAGFDLPNDRQRVDDISRLIDRGYLNQIVVGQDMCMKMRLCRYGGHGYAHILDNVLPRMRDHGISDEAIHTILVENPRRVLTFV